MDDARPGPLPYTLREMVYIAVFGALWGGVEISLGALIHVLHLPQGGDLLALIGIAILLVGRSVVGRRGSVLLMGVVAALLKMLSLGGMVLNPMIAIAMESVLVELALWWGRPSLARFIGAGILGALWNLAHPFVVHGLLAGWGIWGVYRSLIFEGADLFGLPEGAVWAILGALLLEKVAVGVLAGVAGWQVARQVRRRLRWLRTRGEEEASPGGAGDG